MLRGLRSVFFLLIGWLTKASWLDAGCNDWYELIPTTLAISGNDFLLIGEMIP